MRSLGKNGSVSLGDVTVHGRVQDPVGRKLISANSGLKLNLGFSFVFSKAFSRPGKKEHQFITLQAKRNILNLLFKFSYLNLYFAPTLSYLNPL